MVDEKSISIVIPNLDSPVVDRTIRALREQTRGPAEIIVVGLDGRGLVREDERVTFICTQCPVNPAVARNMGIQRARGQWLVFLDADCVPAPDWLERLIACGDGGAPVVGGAVLFSTDNYWQTADNIAIFHEYLPSSPRGARRYLPTINLCLHRKVFDEVGGFDETLPTAEDIDLTTRLHQRGFPLYFEPTAVVYHLAQRRSLSVVIRRSLVFGGNSILVRRRYGAAFGIPSFVDSPWLLAVLAPAIAAYTVFRIFLADRTLWRYWPTAPAVFLAKVAWCWGAAASLRRAAAPQAHAEVGC